MSPAIFLFASLIIFLLLSVPVGFSLILASVLTILMTDINLPFNLITQVLITANDSFPLMAIPFFILAGVIMNNGGIAMRLVNCAKVLAGRMPGSLAQTNVLANMMFGSISGSGVAAAAAVGSTMAPMQEKEGYDRAFSAAVNIASAPTGMLIPPSNTLIVFSLVSGGTSIAALFMAGYIPGILWGIACMIAAFIIAKRRGYKSNEKVPFKVALKVFIDAIPSLLLIIIVIGGIILGAFTATEGSAIAVVYALLLSFIYRTIKIKDLPRILIESTRTTAIVIFLIGVSTIMSWVMSFTGIPRLIADTLLGFTDNMIIILIIMNIVLLIVGTFMDPTPAILIFTPIFLPIALQFGMDPVHFGIMVVFNLSIGTITPPVGPVLFVGARVAKLKIEQVIRPLIPFFAVTVVVLLLVTYIPDLSLWLPKLLGLIE